MIRGIHHVSLHTANFDRLVDFYREAFGFHPADDEMDLKDNLFFDQITGVSGGAARVLMLKTGNCYLELFEWSAPEGRTDPPLKPNDRGYTHFCVDVTDIDEEYRRLSALGMKFVHPEPISIGPFKAVYGRDPDGNVIEIQEIKAGHALTLDKLDAVHLG